MLVINFGRSIKHSLLIVGIKSFEYIFGVGIASIILALLLYFIPTFMPAK